MASVASTPAHLRHSRSRSHAPGLLDQIRQILRAGLWRGRDRHRRSSSYRRLSSSSGGSSDSQSFPQSDCSQSSGRYCRAIRSPHRSPRSISRSPLRHTLGVIALARARLDAVCVLVTALCLVARRSSSVHGHSRILHVPSWWPLRCPWGQSRPPRSLHPSFPFFLLRRRLLWPRLHRESAANSGPPPPCQQGVALPPGRDRCSFR